MTIATEMLAKYMAAEADILLGKTVSFSTASGPRTLGYENLADIRKGRIEWERRVAAERSGRRGSGLSFSVARFDGVGNELP